MHRFPALKIFSFLLVCFLLLAPQAADAALTQKPLELKSLIRAEAPYGTTTLRKFFLKIYDSALWTDAKKWSMDETFALCNRYNLSATARYLAESTVDEMRRSRDIGEEEGEKLADIFSEAFHSVKKGDILTALYVPSKGVVFYYNGQKTKRALEPKLAREFIAIWLGPNTSEPEMRARLLSLKGNK